MVLGPADNPVASGGSDPGAQGAASGEGVPGAAASDAVGPGSGPDPAERGGADPAAQAVLDAVGDLSWEREMSAGDLCAAAINELKGLQGRGFSLVHGGYLDLFGNAWGCVAQKGGHVVVCVVSEGADGTSAVSRLALDADRWEELCER